MLAGRLSPKFRSPALPKIKIQGGTLAQNPQRIMGEFLTFYKSLYSGENSPSPDAIDRFMDNIQIPKLEDRHRQKLDAPISADEVCAVIKNLKSPYHTTNRSPSHSPLIWPNFLTLSDRGIH